MNIMMIPETADRGPNGEERRYSDGSVETLINCDFTVAASESDRIIGVIPAGVTIQSLDDLVPYMLDKPVLSICDSSEFKIDIG